jgi:hypothetical protein
MFDVYVNVKQDRLLVVARGRPVPIIEKAGQWRKKRETIAVSREIKSSIQRDGFYIRRLRSRNLQAERKSALSPVIETHQPTVSQSPYLYGREHRDAI